MTSYLVRDIENIVSDRGVQELYGQNNTQYGGITSACYTGDVGAFLVHDITRRATFENIGRWLRELRDHAGPKILVMLIGNRSDLRHLVAVPLEDGKPLAENELGRGPYSDLSDHKQESS
ncbi:hypothetical protein ACJRO7_006955 [Eucalyptus globulus]|uniref:Uncharacterized protein n=1 Tax=Eucalyptus globulus TaxID=34317 RepID=A0ABD3IN88_EUCGL